MATNIILTSPIKVGMASGPSMADLSTKAPSWVSELWAEQGSPQPVSLPTTPMASMLNTTLQSDIAETARQSVSEGGVFFGAPTYEGSGYSAPFGISAPISTIRQAPVISPVFSPIQTAFAAAPEVHITPSGSTEFYAPPSGGISSGPILILAVGVIFIILILMVMAFKK